MALGQLFFELAQQGCHGLHGLCTHLRIDARFGRRRRSGLRCHTGLAALAANFFGPDGHRRQRRLSVCGGGLGAVDRSAESFEYGLDLLCIGLQGRRIFGVHTRPLGMVRQLIALGQPARHVLTQGLALSQGFLPGFGRQNFRALPQQHSRFTQNLGVMLQFFNDPNALIEGLFKACQRFFGKRGTGFGGVTLPSQSLGQRHFGGQSQGLALLHPFFDELRLMTFSLEVIEFFTQGFGSPLVTGAEFAVDNSHQLGLGLSGQPGSHTGGTLARSGCGESPAGGEIQRGEIGVRMWIHLIILIVMSTTLVA